MEKQKMIICIGGILVATILIIVGVSAYTQQNASVDETEITTTPPTAESLKTILEKAETIESLSYDIDLTITMPQYGTQIATMTIWQEKPYLKEQIISTMMGITNTIIIIQRPEGTYVYDAAQGKYVLSTEVSSYATSLQYLDSKTIKDLLNNQSITDFETDIIDGKKATVIEYTLPVIGENLMTMQVWIWNEKGLPLKAHIDMTMEEISMTMDFVFNNYSFADIPDSTFNVT